MVKRIMKRGSTLLTVITVAVQSFSHVWLFASPWTAARQASLSFTISWSLLKLMSIKLVMPSNHIIRCHPLLLLPSILPSIRVFFNESALCITWPKYWSFSNILPMNTHCWYPLGLTGLISLQFKETLKGLLQHDNSKISILQCSVFFIVQFYWMTGKTIALTIWTFVGKLMSLF